ncbi:hypothetical protein M8C21_022411 [Ambrosia artemisiifolia]|uniref:Uncharacterized protein n=1 Tax=Ambrosia artemisiifolia TaxID=4212 RepID=A0AAD5GAP7_AMBAR|nr:hypothetical protein M8C21_022411 [Ambrosia artemisiifolia]
MVDSARLWSCGSFLIVLFGVISSLYPLSIWIFMREFHRSSGTTAEDGDVDEGDAGEASELGAPQMKRYSVGSLQPGEAAPPICIRVTRKWVPNHHENEIHYLFV